MEHQSTIVRNDLLDEWVIAVVGGAVAVRDSCLVKITVDHSCWM